MDEKIDIASAGKLMRIPLNQIQSNDENPRIIFRQEDMDALVDSISRNGVLVPLTVFKRGNRFVLLDGERRWRCCMKLNMKEVPAIVCDEPDELTNILYMFNIHSLREQWDLLTIALKLRDIMALAEREDGREPTEIRLSELTGLSRGVIRRCKRLLALPEKYHDMILEELKKPKRQQKLTEDFFIEMENALTTVERALPEVIPNRDRVRKVLISKFRSGLIDNRVMFRKVAKIARSEKVGVDAQEAADALEKLFSRNKVSIEDAYSSTVSSAYDERDFESRLKNLVARLQSIDHLSQDDSSVAYLQIIIKEAQRILGRLVSEGDAE